MIRISIWDIILIAVLLLILGFFFNDYLSPLAQDKSSIFRNYVALLFSTISIYYATIRPQIVKQAFKITDNLDRSPLEESKNVSWFPRLKVSVYGDQIAKSCVGRMLAICDEQGKPYEFDALNFFWSRQDDKQVRWEPVDILGKNDYHFLDLIQFKEAENIVTLRVSTSGQMLKRKLDFAPNSFFIKIGLYSEGVKPWEKWAMLERDLQDSSMPYKVIINKKPPNWRPNIVTY